MTRSHLPVLLAALLLANSAHAQADVRATASVGIATVDAASGFGPSVGVEVERPFASGRLIGAARFGAIAVSRDAIAEDYTYDDALETCAETASGDDVDAYLCNPFDAPGNEFLGAYSADVAFAPGRLPLALGVGVRFAEEVDAVAGKGAVTRPFATALFYAPLSPRLFVALRARGGVDLAEGHAGLGLKL